jgi:DNA polymerase-3 subunit epsilon
MKLNLNRPLVFFDLETTGINVNTDRIIEICAIKVTDSGDDEKKVWRINPQMHIPEVSTSIHGITDSDVADCPTFAECADEIFNFLNDSDMAGFNSNKFDVPLLVEEFKRAGKSFSVVDRKFVDVQNIYHKLEKRTLVAAYKYYCHKDLTDAHSAAADALATKEVLEAQLDMYPEQLQNSVDFLSDFSRLNDSIDLAGRFVKDENGEERINFGKHKGKKLRDVLRMEPGFYNWIMQGDFAQDTKQVLTRIWLNMKYPNKK